MLTISYIYHIRLTKLSIFLCHGRLSQQLPNAELVFTTERHAIAVCAVVVRVLCACLSSEMAERRNTGTLVSDAEDHGKNQTGSPRTEEPITGGVA